MDGEAVEAIRDHRAGRTARRVVRSEHEVVDEELRASAEEVRQRGTPFIGLEAISLIDWYPRQFLPLACKLVTSAREFLFCFEQFELRFQPLFACSGLVCSHCAFLLSLLSRSDLVFGCHA